MLTFDTLLAARDAVRSKKISSVELTRQALSRIDRLEPQILAFNSVYPDRALEQAKAVDDGKRTGPLAGVPMALKDNLCTSYGTTTCSSQHAGEFSRSLRRDDCQKTRSRRRGDSRQDQSRRIRDGLIDREQRLQNHAESVGHRRVPGGSSGGSAAALAAGMCCASIGSDTGGSIRQPAALCGVVGLKPTYGRVSRYGLVAFASSLDQIGPFGWTVPDVALLMNVISGRDPKDSTSVDKPVPDYLKQLDQPLKGVRIGIAREYQLTAGMDAQVKSAVDAAIEKISGHRRANWSRSRFPHTEYGIAAYYVIAPCEASSNLARYDGVHFGHRTDEPVKDIIELFSKSRAEGFGEEVQRRIMIGTYALSSGYYDAYYLRALKVRALIKRDFDQAFEKCDVILCPTSPTPAFKAGEKTGDPLQMYLCDVFTVTCNIAGIAGISLPCGFTSGPKPLPIGLQLLGPTFGEEKLLRIARMYEMSTDWHKRRPALDGN